VINDPTVDVTRESDLEQEIRVPDLVDVDVDVDVDVEGEKDPKSFNPFLDRESLTKGQRQGEQDDGDDGDDGDIPDLIDAPLSIELEEISIDISASSSNLLPHCNGLSDENSCLSHDHHHHHHHHDLHHRHNHDHGGGCGHERGEDHHHCHDHEAEDEDAAQDEDHGHSHGPEVGKDATMGTKVFALFLMFVLSVHGVIEGLALGVQTTHKGVIAMFVAIISHRWVDSLALGSNFVRSESPSSTISLLSFAYSLITPFGIFIGLVFQWVLSGDNSVIFTAVITGVSAGTFVYIATIDILTEEFKSSRDRFLKFGFTVGGFLLTATLFIFLDKE